MSCLFVYVVVCLVASQVGDIIDAMDTEKKWFDAIVKEYVRTDAVTQAVPPPHRPQADCRSAQGPGDLT